MQKEEIERVVKALIIETFHLKNPIDLQELSSKTVEEWDSIGHLSLMMAIEGKIGISFDIRDIQLLTSLEAICDKLSEILD